MDEDRAGSAAADDVRGGSGRHAGGREAGGRPATAATGRTVVVGAGKAAAAMARTVEDAWPGALSGLVVTGTTTACQQSGSRWSRRRTPTRTRPGSGAAARILDLAKGLGPDDLLLCLISGGGSALMAMPAGGLTLADKQAVTGRCCARGHHRRDQLRAQAPLGHQGRPARGRGGAGPRRRPAHLGRAGRRSVGDRLRPYGSRSYDLRRGPRGTREVSHRRAEGGARPPRRSS